MAENEKTVKNEKFYDYAIKNVRDLREFEENPNLHNDKNIDELAASIREFGFSNPILIDEDDVIIAGHGRLAAAKLIKMKEVPCIIMAGLTDVQRRAYVIADNSLPYGSEWDEDLLLQQIEQLELDGFDLDILALDNIEDIDFGNFTPPDVPDGHAKDPKETVEQADTKLVIGEYSFPIARDEYLKWQDDIRATAGFDSASVISEIKRRLQVCCD